MANENGLLIMTLKGGCERKAKGFYIEAGTLVVDDTLVLPFPKSLENLSPELQKGSCSSTDLEYALVCAYRGARAIAKTLNLKVGDIKPLNGIEVAKGRWSQTFSCILT